MEAGGRLAREGWRDSNRISWEPELDFGVEQRPTPG